MSSNSKFKKSANKVMRISNSILNELNQEFENSGDDFLKKDEHVETMSVEYLKNNPVLNIEKLGSQRYQADSSIQISQSAESSSGIIFADVHSDSDGVLFKNLSQPAQSKDYSKTNDFFKDEKKKRRLPEEQLDSVKEALIDLYLSVKIRTNEEIDIYDENKLAQERDKLRVQNKVDEMTLIEYIKLSIEILMNMKYEDFQKEANLQAGGFMCKNCRTNQHTVQTSKLLDQNFEQKFESGPNSNRFMTKSQLSGLSRSSSMPLAHAEYEKIIQNYENDIRNHIKTQQQLKLYIEGAQEKSDETNKKYKKLQADLADQNTEYTKLQEDLKQLAQNLKNKTQLNKKNQELINGLQFQISETKEQNSKLENKVQELEKQIQTIKNENSKIKKQMVSQRSNTTLVSGTNKSNKDGSKAKNSASDLLEAYGGNEFLFDNRTQSHSNSNTQLITAPLNEGDSRNKGNNFKVISNTFQNHHMHSTSVSNQIKLGYQPMISNSSISSIPVVITDAPRNLSIEHRIIPQKQGRKNSLWTPNDFKGKKQTQQIRTDKFNNSACDIIKQQDEQFETNKKQQKIRQKHQRNYRTSKDRNRSPDINLDTLNTIQNSRNVNPYLPKGKEILSKGSMTQNNLVQQFINKKEENQGDLSHRRSKSMVQAVQNAKKAQQRADNMIYKQQTEGINYTSKKCLSKRTGRTGSTLVNDPYNEMYRNEGVIKAGRRKNFSTITDQDSRTKKSQTQPSLGQQQLIMTYLNANKSYNRGGQTQQNTTITSNNQYYQ